VTFSDSRPVVPAVRARAMKVAAPTTRRLPLRVLTMIVTVLASAIVVVGVIEVLTNPLARLIDANTYLSAGERLNAGHALYVLAPGDRIANLQNGVPLASPPFIAALWRPLAALGPWIVIPWTIACAAGAAVAVIAASRANRLVTALLVLVLWQSAVWTLTTGNVNGLLMAGTVLVGLRPRWAAVLIGVMAAVKIWPIFLAIAVIRTRRQIVALVGMLAICAAISLIGAGWQAHVDYLGIVGRLGQYGTSLGSLTVWWMPWAVLAIGSILALGSYRSAILTSVLANPALHAGSWFTLLPAIAHNVVADERVGVLRSDARAAMDQSSRGAH
jgi:hypothetical protein